MEIKEETTQLDQPEEEDSMDNDFSHYSNSEQIIEPHDPPISKTLPLNDDNSQKVFPHENEEYHDRILSLLKIKNNSNLNKFYYSNTPFLLRSQLSETDLSINNEQTLKTIEEMVPHSLFSKRMRLIIQCRQKTQPLIITSNTAKLL